MTDYMINLDTWTSKKLEKARGPLGPEEFIKRTLKDSLKDVRTEEDMTNPYSTVIHVPPVDKLLIGIPPFITKLLKIREGEQFKWELTKTGQLLLTLEEH